MQIVEVFACVTVSDRCKDGVDGRKLITGLIGNQIVTQAPGTNTNKTHCCCLAASMSSFQRKISDKPLD